MTRRSKHLPRAQRYLSWKADVAQQFTDQALGFRYDKSAKLFVSCLFLVSRYIATKDTDNLLKAVNDTLQYAAIVPNDRQIYAAFGAKFPSPRDLAFIEIREIGQVNLKNLGWLESYLPLRESSG